MEEEEHQRLKEEVLRFVREHPGVLTSEILERFGEYEPLVVLKALDELEEEGLVSSRPARSDCGA